MAAQVPPLHTRGMGAFATPVRVRIVSFYPAGGASPPLHIVSTRRTPFQISLSIQNVSSSLFSSLSFFTSRTSQWGGISWRYFSWR